MTNSLRRFRPVLDLALLSLAIGLPLRIALWVSFGRPTGVTAEQLFAGLGLGLLNDAVQALYLLAPLSLYVLLMPDHWFRSAVNRRLMVAGTFVFLFVSVYLAVVEYFFFEEFNARLNLVAFDYLLYPHEVFIDIWQSYPVATVIVCALWLSAAAVLLLRPRLARVLDVPATLRQRLVPFAVHAVALALAIAAFSANTLTPYSNRVANEIAMNGISTFFRAARTSDIEYAAYYLTRDTKVNLALVARDLASGGGEFSRLAEGRLDRHFAADPRGLGRLNVVVVMEESFGAEFSKLHGANQDLTPQFDALARRGVWFRNTYASGTRTVRGLEAITTSLPPIPTVSVLRRPGNEGIANWGDVMRQHGYHASFMYGGYGYFDNMNYFYSHNGFEVIDRQAIPHPRFGNIWGVADEDLFEHALACYDELARTGQPFFSMIMTTSNHKPFTFRPGIPGVKAEGGGREAGVRYADFALGEFIRAAQHHPWFDDTLFVVVADHGARVYGRAEIPLRTFEIPLAFYAPKHLAPRVVEAQTTQIDIAPTVLGLLGFEYTAPFFGQDVLKHPQAANISFFSHNHDVAVLRDGVLTVLGLQKTHETFIYDRENDRYVATASRPDLLELAVAYYQTASELYRSHGYEIDKQAPHVADVRSARTAVTPGNPTDPTR